MRIIIYSTLIIILLSCSTKEYLPILRTNSKVISIQDGNDFHKDIWTLSSEVELDEYITTKFHGEKQVSFISDIDTIMFNVTPNKTYDFVIHYKQEKAFTRINTDTLKEASIPPEKILEYYHKNENRTSLTDTIPFILGVDNRIHIKGKINSSDSLDFLFDTGANAIVIEADLIGDKVQLELDGTTENEGSDGVQTIATSSNNKLEIDNLRWKNVRLLSIDYQNPNFDGVLGWIAFENKIVEINYEKNILIIHQSMETVPKHYSKIETKMIGDVPYIKGKIILNDKEIDGWFEYDSGSNGSFNMSQKFASENSLNNAMKKTGTSVSSGSAGFQWKANDYILPKLQFGVFELIDVPLSINEKDPIGIENNDILGNHLLKQFNAIIDLQNFEIYLKSNHLRNAE